MSTRDIDALKNELVKNRIELSDTISQFMEKCNNNFSAIIEWGGGPAGEKGDGGDPGVPTKPKVPIHVWRELHEYSKESHIGDDEYEIVDWYENLSDVKYQEGHLIMLKNAHVYILESSDYSLKPKYVMKLQSYDPGDVINGQNAYMHIAYANAPNSFDGFITDQQLRGEDYAAAASTFDLRRTATVATEDSNISDKPYMGVYSDNHQDSSTNPNRYTWVRIQGGDGAQGIQGEKGERGEKGEKGDKGDGYTGHLYTIDLEGDMSTISINSISRTLMYDNDFCECTIHAYYGDENVLLNAGNVTINLPEMYAKTYKFLNDGTIVSLSNQDDKIGKIETTQRGNDVNIKFTPDPTFVFPKTTIFFPIHIDTHISDIDTKETYNFNRDTVWMIKGITSSFELEIIPQYRIIKLSEEGKYYPEKLSVSVYKVEDGERNLFDVNNNNSFSLLYKNINDDNDSWKHYQNEVDTIGISCLEFKLVKNYGSTDTENPEEIWDYENVWVVADGKSSHYYHADLGNAESMMILTTGEKINIGTEDHPIYCAELKNPSGYSITFEPKFYDGTIEYEVESINIGSNSGDEYYTNGTFERFLDETTLTITKVPYGVDMIPMNIVIAANCPVYDESGNYEYILKYDTISFNVYISTVSDIYTLVPTVSSYNTSTGKIGDTIGCSVFKNNECIDTTDLDKYGLSLKYVVFDGGTDDKTKINYTEPLVYGDDDDIYEDEFTAKDVAIEFILYYRSKEVAKSTVSFIKDGIDGKDGDSWQYIFSRSPIYPFEDTGISDPSTWVDNNPTDSNNELLGNNGVEDKDWYDDHKGIDSEYRYEYQSYRKWDKNNKCWGKYGKPTLYSNYSESGSGYSVLLSNPIAVIPVGNNDWSVDENMTNQTDSTLVYLYNNISNISSNNNVTISLPENNIYVQKGNFEATKENGVNKVTFKPIVDDSIFDFGSNNQYKLPITLVYNLDEDGGDKFATTINWTLSPIKGLNDVEVFVDKHVVNTSISEKHTLKVGYYLISSNDSKKFIDTHNIGNVNDYKIILTDDIEDLSSGPITNWKNAEYNFVKNGENRNCYVVLVKSDGSTIIDYTNVISVNDGSNGKSAIHLELTQDNITLPCDPRTGGVHEYYNVSTHPIYFKMMLYSGDELIEDYNNISYTFKIDGGPVVGFTPDGTGGFDVPIEVIRGDTNIECIATYNGTSYHKTLSIYLEKTPYEIELSKNVLTRDINSGTIVDEELYARVKYWMGGKWVYTDKGTLVANTVNGKDKFNFDLIISEDYIRRFVIKNSTFFHNTVDTEIRISYYDENSTQELSFETVGIINNGKNGSAPSCTTVTILGYSLIENEDINDNSKWKSSINELGTLETGQPIYILNEYTWSDGTKTKGITVTLAGTQGVEGKSRVLFYLGSFKDGTLTGLSIAGLLTDERCDYFIDIQGRAWMRRGTAEIALSSFEGPNSTDNWVQSTKVGFLQVGAIHADMINTGSITANSALVTTLFAQEVEAKKLKVEAANIQGTLTAGQINATGLKISAENITADGKIPSTCIDVNGIATNVINAASGRIGELITDHIKSNKITVEDIDGDITSKIDVNGIATNVIKAAQGDIDTLITNKIYSTTITADMIDTSNLSVSKLNTKPNEDIDKIEIKDNSLKIFSNFYDEDINGNKDIEYINSSTLITSENITPVKYLQAFEKNISEKFNQAIDTLNKLSDNNRIDMIQSTSNKDEYCNKNEFEFFNRELGLLNAGAIVKINLASFYICYPSEGYAHPYYVEIFFNNNTNTKGLEFILEKYNNNSDTWDKCEKESFFISDEDCSCSGNIYSYKFDDIQIKERGVYRCRLIMHKFFTVTNINPLYYCQTTSFSTKRNLKKSQYVEIGKNGLMVKMDANENGYGGFNYFYITPNEISMYIENKEGSGNNDCCGLKLDSTKGLQFKDKSNWLTLKEYIQKYK